MDDLNGVVEGVAWVEVGLWEVPGCWCVSASDVIYTRESVGGRVRDDDGRTGWLAGWLPSLPYKARRPPYERIE